MAACHGHKKTVELLLSKDASVDQADKVRKQGRLVTTYFPYLAFPMSEVSSTKTLSRSLLAFFLFAFIR